MKLYLDVFFLVNFLMNALVLEIVLLIFQKKLLSLRNFLAAAVGAAMPVGVVVAGIGDKQALFLLLYILTGCIQIRIVWGKTTFRGMLHYLLWLYLCGVFTAGALLMLRRLAGFRQISMVFLLTASILILLIAQKIIISQRKTLFQEQQNRFTVHIAYRGRMVSGTGFLDTGNRLYEPISHECVTVVEYKLFQELLTKEEQKEFHGALQGLRPELFQKLRLRYIPFHSLGKEQDALLGIRVDDLEIQVEKNKVIHTGKTWLGLSKGFLSSDCGYELLLNQELFANIS